MLCRLALHPCRESLQKMLGHNTEGRLPTRKQHCIVTLSMFCIVLCLGATLTELGTVFAIIGGVSTTAIGIVYISNLQCVLKPLNLLQFRIFAAWSSVHAYFLTRTAMWRVF